MNLNENREILELSRLSDAALKDRIVHSLSSLMQKWKDIPAAIRINAPMSYLQQDLDILQKFMIVVEDRETGGDDLSPVLSAVQSAEEARAFVDQSDAVEVELDMGTGNEPILLMRRHYNARS